MQSKLNRKFEFFCIVTEDTDKIYFIRFIEHNFQQKYV